MGEDRRIFEYFVVAGVPDDPEELTTGAQECGYKDTSPQPPITDICIIFPGLGEQVPEGFTCIETTPTGFPADLNHGSIRTPSCYLCYRRGFHKPPLVDLGVLYEGRGERVNLDSQMLKTTPFGRSANVNNASQGIFLTYRRAAENAPSNLLAVTDVCVILTNKNETPPHTFYKINKNLNKGMVGSDVFLCYKKSLANSCRIAYKPAILDRFPLEDYSDYPLPSSVPIFGLPMGAVIECWPAKCQSPSKQFLTFVLTDQKGHKLYGAAVSFYEQYTKHITNEQMEKLGLNPEFQLRSGSCSDSTSTNDPAEQMTFHTNKCICLVSRYPFFNSFKRFLFWLHRMAVQGTYPLPIERYISHLMYEVPFPTARRPRIMVQVGNERILFDNPEDSPLPINGASYCDCLRLLGADNYMYLMLLTLLEQKILIHSLRPWYLTSVAEALSTLIFPFHWQCPYIPQCPLDLAGVLHAPLPFVVGVDSRYFELYEDPPKDVTCVDLDTNTVSQSEIRQRIKLGLLPRRCAKILRQQLEALHSKVMQEEFNVRETRSTYTQGFLPVEVDLRLHHKRRILELQIQETFLRFMIMIMKGYQQYLKPIRGQPSVGATDLEALFDVNGFLRSRDKSSQEFYKMLVNTQLFIRFVEERSFLSDKDRNAYMAFFDECMEKVDALGDHAAVDTKILDVEENPSELENAVLFALPEVGVGGSSASTAASAMFMYAGHFPQLKRDHFALDKLITEDGRSSLLRMPMQMSNIVETCPAARRTRQEARTALKLAKQQSTSPVRWAKCLLSYAYSLWFIHLPSYVKVSPSKQKSLRVAYNVLDRMLNAKLPLTDEVCFRILIQVCGQYGHPVMAVKIFLDMKRLGITPNAITYGFYNRAVLEAQWPSSKALDAQKYWTKIRHVVRAVALFNKAYKERRKGRRTLSQYSTESGDFMSQGSLNSQQSKLPDAVSVGTVISNETTTCSDGKKLNEDKSPAQFDQGYQSQTTEDSTSTGLESTSVDGICRSQSISLRVSQSKLTASDCAALDKLCDSRNLIVRKGSLNATFKNLLSYDSSAGLLMTTDVSLLDDSVFETSQENGLRKKRLRHRSLGGNGNAYSNGFGRVLAKPKSGRKLSDEQQQRLSSNNNDPKDSSDLRLQLKEQFCSTPTKVLSPMSVSNLGFDAHILKDYSENGSLKSVAKSPTSEIDITTDSKTAKLGNIPEEVVDNEDTNVHHFVSSLMENDFTSRMSPSKTPVKMMRTVVTENDPLGGLGMCDADVSTEVVDKLATTNSTTSTPSRKQILFDKKPFDDDFDEQPSKTPDAAGDHYGFLGLSRFGRDSVRGLLNRLSITPTGGGGQRMTKSHTLDASNFSFSQQTSLVGSPTTAGTTPATPVAASTTLTNATTVTTSAAPLEQPETADDDSAPSSPSYDSNTGGAMPVSPSLSHLMSQAGAKMLSKMDVLQKHDSFARLKTGVSSVYKELKNITGNLDQIGSPLRGSLSSLSMATAAEASGIYLTPDIVTSDDAWSLKDDDSVLWLKNVEESSTPNVVDLPLNDPAFQLSSGDTGDLINFDYTSATIAAANSQTDVAGKVASVDAYVCTEVLLCTCTKCPHCSTYCYDDEIMAGWVPDDSELTTRCQFCCAKFVPNLNVVVRKCRRLPTQSWYVKSASLNRGRTGSSHSIALERKGSFESSLTTPKRNRMTKDKSTLSLENVDELSNPYGPVEHTSGTPKSCPPLNIRRGEHESSLFKEAINRRLFSSTELSKGETSSSKEALFEIGNNGNKLLTPRNNGEYGKETYFSVPFLCPIVVRKELENVVSSEGDDCLVESKSFIEEHPILFWNLLYTFQRISAPTHFVAWLPGHFQRTVFIDDEDAEPLPVFVRCVYDWPKLHDDDSTKPIYFNCSKYSASPLLVIDEENGSNLMRALLIEHRVVSHSVVSQIIDYLSVPNLHKPIQLMINENRKRSTPRGNRSALPRHFSIYRDIMLLALLVFDKDLRLDDFDREYASAFTKLPPKIASMLPTKDRPPSVVVRACRKIFMPLDAC